jgi:hypothetical protein
VHLGCDNEAASFFARYGLADVARIADRERTIYSALGLQRATPAQLFSLRSWRQALWNGALFKHGAAWSGQNAWQMPGTFVIHRGEIVYQHRPEAIADEADFDVDQVCTLGRH